MTQSLLVKSLSIAQSLSWQTIRLRYLGLWDPTLTLCTWIIAHHVSLRFLNIRMPHWSQ